jgi:hypothetical protein
MLDQRADPDGGNWEAQFDELPYKVLKFSGA